MVDSADDNLCFAFRNFTMKLFYSLGFTIDLVFGSLTSVTKLNLFLGGSRFFKEPPAGIVCHPFEAFSRGCILLELEFLPIIVFFL